MYTHAGGQPLSQIMYPIQWPCPPMDPHIHTVYQQGNVWLSEVSVCFADGILSGPF